MNQNKAKLQASGLTECPLFQVSREPGRMSSFQFFRVRSFMPIMAIATSICNVHTASGKPLFMYPRLLAPPSTIHALVHEVIRLERFERADSCSAP